MNNIVKHATAGLGGSLFLSPEIQGLFDDFSACFGARIAFFSTEMKELKVGLEKPSCSFCTLLRNKTGRRQCDSEDRAGLMKALRKRSLHCYVCHAGLTEAINPVYRNDKLIGYIMIGQFRSGAASPSDRILEKCRKRGMPIAELKREFILVPEISPVKLPHMLGVFRMLCRLIASESMVKAEGDRTIDAIISELKVRAEWNPSLDEVARKHGRSTSSISKLFKSRLGKTFKQLVIDMKLDMVQDRLLSDSTETVKSAASYFGFDDQFYLSRLFKKHRGYTPSSLKKSRRAKG